MPTPTKPKEPDIKDYALHYYSMCVNALNHLCKMRCPTAEGSSYECYNCKINLRLANITYHYSNEALNGLLYYDIRFLASECLNGVWKEWIKQNPSHPNPLFI